MAEIIHVMRESSVRPRSFHLLCRPSPRQADAWVLEPMSQTREEGMVDVNCERCLAVLAREAAAAAANAAAANAAEQQL